MQLLWGLIWKYHKDKFPNLLTLARLALTSTVHTAGCERGFSVQNQILTKLRNRLNVETQSKLMRVKLCCLERNVIVEKALSVWRKSKTRRAYALKMPNLKVLLINTKVERSTRALVQGVRDKLQKYPDIINPALDSIDAISKESVQILSHIASNPQQSTLYEPLMEMILMNQLQLKVLGVSHPTLDTICQSCEELGLTAKLTGAGGGGCAYCLIPPGNIM
ncbi:hypothetical protein FSP39_013172 [Pinctada imbricata]|uniref:HAT C-terminal dimerisation domain-containing protein n=1 Tax=Pinctada imbricata TaxID=66713 RepID=A0AA89BI00_PINIB|nr:hypothetical protein FSP39_013172 [Pinctada imbricata]